MEVLELGVLERAVDARRGETDRGPPAVEVLFDPRHRVVGERLDGPLVAAAVRADQPGALGVSQCLEHAVGPTSGGLSAELGGPEDGCRGRLVEVVADPVGAVVRSRADPPRVKQPRRVAPVVGRDLLPEDVGALEKERALLGEEDLVGAEVDLRGIGLDLAEVRVDRPRDRRVGPEPELEVEARRRQELAVVVERVGGIGLGEGRAEGSVGQELEALGRLEVGEPVELSEERHLLSRLARSRRPEAVLVEPLDKARDLKPPGLPGFLRIAQLRERNAELRDPAPVVDPRAPLPHGVPADVGLGVVEAEQVALDAGRVEPEHERGAPIVIGVEAHVDPVRRRVLVPPGQPADDQRRPGVVRANPDVHRDVVIQDAKLGAKPRGLALVRLALPEVGVDRRGLPRRLVEAPVDREGAGRRGRSRDPARELGGRDRLRGVGGVGGDQHLRLGRGARSGRARDHERGYGDRGAHLGSTTGRQGRGIPRLTPPRFVLPLGVAQDYLTRGHPDLIGDHDRAGDELELAETPVEHRVEGL